MSVPEIEMKATSQMSDEDSEKDIQRVLRSQNRSKFTIFPDNNIKHIWDVITSFFIFY